MPRSGAPMRLVVPPEIRTTATSLLRRPAATSPIFAAAADDRVQGSKQHAGGGPGHRVCRFAESEQPDPRVTVDLQRFDGARRRRARSGGGGGGVVQLQEELAVYSRPPPAARATAAPSAEYASA